MKKLDWKVFVLLGIIVSITIGFLLGTGILGGEADDPGSSGDPLASQSYADSAINRRVQEMDTRIASLEAKVKSLEDEITILNGGTVDPEPSTGTGSGTASGGTSSAGSTGGTGGTSGGASSANIGKSGNVTAEVVNLRESASTSSNIKKRLTPSDTFTITKVDNNWYQVQLSDGTVGWVFGDYVRVR